MLACIKVVEVGASANGTAERDHAFRLQVAKLETVGALGALSKAEVNRDPQTTSKEEKTSHGIISVVVSDKG